MNKSTQQREETDPGAISRWLQRFLDSQGALLEPVDDPSDASPVVVRHVEASGKLCLDVGAVPFAQRAFEGGARVVVSRFCGDDHVATAPLRLLTYAVEQGRELASLEAPERLLITRRRREFRAHLRRELHCRVALSVGSLREPLYGELLNLSVGGCQARFPLAAIHIPDAELKACSLLLSFPNGENIALECLLRHLDPLLDKGQITCGFEFTAIDNVRERMLWYCVCEIERESARAADAGRELPPSALFRAAERPRGLMGSLLASERQQYATIPARQLGYLGDGVGVLLHDLKRRGRFESSALSRLADSLLALHEQDRQELLFALICQPALTRLVRHCLGVAVRLTDVGRQLGMPREQVKAVAACALVHDLPLAVDHGLDVDPRDIIERCTESQALLVTALKRCGWLPAPVIVETVEQVNERLDGSGVPRGLSGDRIGHLGRLAGVVDELDLRTRPGREAAALTFESVRQRLLQNQARFASRWVDYCYSVFGPIPVGAPVIADGFEFWLRRLHADGRCASLVPRQGISCPTPDDVEASVTGVAIAGLGAVREIEAKV